MKQSIYGFRMAEPTMFTERIDEFSRRDAALHLSANFRSSNEVIEGVNSIFTPIMTRETGGVDTTKPPASYTAAGTLPRAVRSSTSYPGARRWTQVMRRTKTRRSSFSPPRRRLFSPRAAYGSCYARALPTGREIPETINTAT